MLSPSKMLLCRLTKFLMLLLNLVMNLCALPPMPFQRSMALVALERNLL